MRSAFALVIAAVSASAALPSVASAAEMWGKVESGMTWNRVVLKGNSAVGARCADTVLTALSSKCGGGNLLQASWELTYSTVGETISR
jgi:hypothetical protein